MQISVSSAHKVLAVGAALALIGTLWYAPSRSAILAPTEDRPNIILITLDCLRADYLSGFGYPKPTTPFLDELFARGVVFENAQTTAFMTYQVDGTFLSGRYPSEHNVQTWSTPISREHDLLPEVLKTYGYATGAFVSIGIRDAMGLTPVFDTYRPLWELTTVPKIENEVRTWIADQDEPFFLFWHISDLHQPYIPPFDPRFYTGTYDGPLASAITGRWEEWKSGELVYQPGPLSSGYPGTPEVVPVDVAFLDFMRGGYETNIARTDRELEAFFDKLPHEVCDNSIIVITSEHGEDMGGHDFILHRDIYDNVTHVPLAIIYPQHLAPARIATPVSVVGLMPTILDLAGIPSASDRSLTPYLQGDTTARPVYIERPPYDEYAVRLGSWKYIMRNLAPLERETFPGNNDDWDIASRIKSYDLTTGDELYELTSDPGEQLNLIGRNLPIEAKLRALAEAFREEMRAARAHNNIPPSPESIFTYP